MSAAIEGAPESVVGVADWCRYADVGGQFHHLAQIRLGAAGYIAGECVPVGCRSDDEVGIPFIDPLGVECHRPFIL